jgi:hypothetical protein
MKLRHALPLLCLALCATIPPSGSHAQETTPGESDTEFVLQQFPLELPADVIAAGESMQNQQGEYWALLDSNAEACAEHFSELYRSAAPLRDGWRLSGFGTGPDARQRRRWRYGVISEDGQLRRLTVTDEDGQCRVGFSTDSITIRADRFRWPWPELTIPEGSSLAGTPIPLDTLNQNP